MAFSALHRVSAQDVYAETAQNTFRRILERKDNPKGIYNKHIAENRPLRNFSLPMILCNLSLEMAHLLDPKQVEEVIDEVLHEVMHVFLNTEKMLIYENVLADGSFSDSFDGRLMNPGHAMEAMWFVMDLAERRNDEVLFKKATAVAFSTLEFGWDQQHGGVFYFLDAKGNPPQQLEWDQKLWWVHLESLVCMSRIWRHAQDPRAKEWFNQLHEYAWNRFRDPEFGEWYGYLNRQGQPLLSLKGGKWKGFFHVPRALMEVSFSLASKGIAEVEKNTL
jgi:N-acylglucosamine 2-epimerase